MAYLLLVTWLGFAVVSLIGLWQQDTGDWRLEVEPHYIHVTPGSPVTVTCTLSDGAGGRVPLAGCGFRDHESGTAWDIGTGSATINNTIRGEETSALITSNTEDAGRCRLQIEGLPVGYTYILGCRVRPVTGTWRYAAMMVYVSGRSPQQYRLQPPGVLVSQAGSDVILTGLAEHKVDVCSFSLPPDNTVIRLYPGRTSENTTEYRAWQEGRRCGVTLLGVKPEGSGFVASKVWSRSPYSTSADFVELLVATPPVSPPLLSVNNTDAPFQAGDMLHATCLVGESRPVSNITWLLGGVVIRADDLDEAPVESTWRWNHDPQKIFQRLSLRLTEQDDDKELICRAGHLALPTGTLNSNKHIIRLGGDCGVPQLSTPLIVQGTGSKRGAWPWLAAMYHNNSFFCGGSLISHKHVLTAAHCIENNNHEYLMEDIEVVLGIFNISNRGEPTAVQRDVAEITIHASYNKYKSNLYDIALLLLNNPVEYTEHIQPICLWTTDRTLDLAINQSATVVGWGQTETDNYSDTPIEGNVRIVSHEECKNLTAPFFRRHISNDTICADHKKDGTVPCSGDNGGPLMVNFRGADGWDRWYLRGIVSAVFRGNETTCASNQFFVYTHVAKFYS